LRLVPGHQPIGLVGSFQQLRLALGAGLLQRLGLRLAAAFGDGFGEIGEQHREPQPQDDLEGEGEALATRHQVAQEDHGGEGCDDLDHEHHGILDHQPRIELLRNAARIAGTTILGSSIAEAVTFFLQFHGFHGRNS
jgi:hypothetical protein